MGPSFIKKLFISILILNIFSSQADQDCYKLGVNNIDTREHEVCAVNLVDGHQEEENCETQGAISDGDDLEALSTNQCVDLENETIDFDSVDLTNRSQPRMAMAFLLKMQNLSKLIDEKTLSVFLGTLHSSLYQKHPKLISRALLNLFLQRPLFYKKVIMDHPKLLELKFDSRQSLCPVNEEPPQHAHLERLVSVLYTMAISGEEMPLIKEWYAEYDIENLIIAVLAEFDLEMNNILAFMKEYPELRSSVINNFILLVRKYQLGLPYLPGATKEAVLEIFNQYIGDLSSFTFKSEDQNKFISAIINKSFYPEDESKHEIPVLSTLAKVGPSLFSTEKKEGHYLHPWLPNTYFKEFTPNQVLEDEETLKYFAQDKEDFKKLYAQMLKNQASNIIRDMGEYGTQIDYWRGLLIPENMTFLTMEERKDLIDRISDTFVKNSMHSEITLDPSSMYYMSYNALSPLVGLEKKDLVKFDTLPGDNSLIALIASSNPIEGADENEYGFFLNVSAIGRPLRSIENSSIDDLTETVDFSIPLSYKQNNKEYQIELEINSSKAFMPIEHHIKSPNYEKMDEDGKVGLIVIGNNYRDSIEAILGNLINFYTQEHGYVPLSKEYIAYNEGDDVNEFYKKHMGPISDTRSAIQKQIENGNIDYFIKLEHAQGNTTNLLSTAKESRMLTFYKPGTQDRLHFLIPSDSEKKEKQVISGEEFGKWISERKKNSDNPLDLFSGSCGSELQTSKMLVQLMLEVKKEGKAGDKLPLRVYPNSSLTSFNIGNKSHPTNAMMNAYLNNQSYQEIEEAMNKAEKYNEGKDRYFFPHNDSY
jgi:hypothetical protein